MDDDKVLKEAMKTVLPKLGLEPGTQYSVSPVSANLWLSAVSRITTVSPDATTLIVKRQPDNRKLADYFDSHMFFHNEAEAYNTVLPALLGLQRQQGLLVEIFDNIPRCLLARAEGGDCDVVVLEDMASKGFSQVPRKTGLVLEEALLVARALGRLHALSVVLRHTLTPEQFASITHSVQETVFSKKHAYNASGAIWKSAANFCLQTLPADLPGGALGEHANKLKVLVADVVHVVMEPSLSVADNEPHNVFCHGDHYTNNFMFKYDGDVAAREVCLLDWQQCRYASPATDVSSLLYLAMEHPGRHHHELLDEYINSVTNMLQRFHVPTSLFTRQHLQQQLAKYAKFAVAVAFVNVPHSLHDHGDEDLQVDLDQKVGEVVAAENQAMSPRARQKLLDIVCDAVSRGYI